MALQLGYGRVSQYENWLAHPITREFFRALKAEFDLDNAWYTAADISRLRGQRDVFEAIRRIMDVAEPS